MTDLPQPLRAAADHGQGSQAGHVPLPVPVLRAVHEAIGDRQSGVILLNARGQRMSPAATTGRLHRLARAIGIDHPVSPLLRRTFCTAGLISGVPLRDMQYAMRHADTRATMRYNMARAKLDRHAARPVAAYLAGIGDGLITTISGATVA